MWIATYDRHLTDELCSSLNFQSKSYIRAWIVYQWWTFFYLMSPYPVKQVSLYRKEDGVIFLQGKEGKSQRLDILRRLKCEESKRLSLF